MNNTRRMPSGLLPLLFMVLMAIGTVQAQDSPTLRKIQGTGVVVVGYRVGSVPFSYLDDHFKPIGYTMDLCHRVVTAIAAVLKQRHLTTKLIAVTPATRIPLVANGTVDLECGVTTKTLSRQKSEAFTVTTFVAQSRLLGKKMSHIQSLSDLQGMTVVSTAGTTSISYLNDVNAARNLKMKILVGKDDAESFQMVEADRAVAYAMDDVLLYSLVANARQPENFLISNEALTVEPYAIALTRNDPAFKKLVDGVLRGLFQSGEIHTIYNKWFLSPIPPKGINLQLPMSAALKRAIASPTDSADPALYQ